MRTLPLAVAAALLAGCAGEPDRSLSTFDDCADMQRYMAKMARKEMSFGWGGGRVNVFGMQEFGLSAEDAAPNSGGADQYSTTNLQESGVDEADIVKTDGEYIYVLAGGRLVVTRGYPISLAQQLGAVTLDGYPVGMYLLDDDRIAVTSRLWWGQPPDPVSGEQVAWRNGESTLVTLVDISDPAAPIIERETYVTGALATTRRIGDQLYLVTHEDIDIASDTGSRREARAELYRAEPERWQARKFDNRLLRSGPDDLSGDWQVDDGPTCGCEDTWHSDDLGGTFVSAVLALDLSDPLANFEGSAVVGRADTVYMSPESLYVAYSEVNDGPFAAAFGSELDTVVHKFGLPEAGAPTYAATGVRPGILSDQFAISELDGVLRLATTRTEDWTSGVYTLEERDGTLVPLDEVTGLAPGETIMSARFVGDLGYIVTWEMQLGDPLFTFDMSDPANIEMHGELAVTGWSDYLHPLGDGHLLAVGMDQGSNGWMELSVSLFDVQDLANPSLKDRELLPAWGSEAQSDHHAFNYFAPTESLTIPSWASDGQTVLEVLHATTEGIDPIGRISQSASLGASDPWCAGVRRSVVMDGWVWAISSAGMTAALVDDPEGQQFAVAFSGVDPCWDYYGGDFGW